MKWLIRLFFLGFIKPFYITTEAALLGSAAIGAFTSAGTGIASGRMNKKTRQLAEKQFNQSLAQSEKWNQISQNNYLNQAQIRVADMQKAGLNPLMYAGDSSASISGGASPTASTSTNNSMDFDGIAQVMSAYANQRLTNKSLDIQKSIEDKKALQEDDRIQLEKDKFEEEKRKNREDENLASLSLAEQKRFNESLVKEKYAELSDKQRHEKQVELMQKLGYAKDVINSYLANRSKQKELDLELKRLELAQTEVVNAKDKADRDRRQKYVDTIVSGITNLVGSGVKLVTGN